MTVRVALGLGSNLDDPRGHLQRAVHALAVDDRFDVHAVSPVYCTDPVGGPEQPEYLNLVVIVQTRLSAADVLAVAQELEAAADRRRTQRWGPRTLDVDVLAYGDEQIETATLVVPHPRARERAFVLVPWADVDPGHSFPDGVTVAEARAAVGDAGVRATDVSVGLG